MKYYQYQIDKDYINIYFFLKDNGFSENYIKNLRKTWGNLMVNGEVVNIKKKLTIGDNLKICSSPNQKTDIQACIIPLDIVYEDEYYLLINKPSGLSTMPNRSHYSNNLAGAITNYMKDKDKNFVVRILNRLDKDTAGIIIVAKDSIAQKEIKEINKRYYAVCEGIIDKEIIVNSPIKTLTDGKINQKKRVTAPDGQKATTIVTPITYDMQHSLIKLSLIHGRTHQIRVHLASIGHALLGDALYGQKSDMISHTALICKEISFYHPFKQQVLTFCVEYPEDIKKILP